MRKWLIDVSIFSVHPFLMVVRAVPKTIVNLFSIHNEWPESQVIFTLYNNLLLVGSNIT
jgi:hypothetical protein